MEFYAVMQCCIYFNKSQDRTTDVRTNGLICIKKSIFQPKTMNRWSIKPDINLA
jgi:hypothetical protein